MIRLTAAFFLLLASCCAALAQDRIALVIGNSAYTNTGVLNNPDADARLVAGTLESLGFAVSLKTDLTRQGFEDAILDFAGKAEQLAPGADGESIALVFYAGHGIQADGENYLIPVDAKIERARDFKRRAISVNSILDDLRESNATLKIMILDACRNNPFPAVERSAARGLAAIDPIDDFIIAFSTNPGNTAEDGSGANSPYSEALAGFMAKDDLTVYEVFGSTYKFVRDLTNGRQKPSATYQVDGRQLRFAAAKPAAALGLLSPDKSAVAATPATEDGGPAVLWEKAKGANTVEAYDEVIKRYPSSQEAKHALIMIGILGDEKAWKEARGINSVGAYKSYLARYPQGIYAAEAQRQIDRLGQLLAATPGDAEDAAIPSLPSRALSTMRVYFGADAYGFDYRSFETENFEDCKMACEADAFCKAVTFNKVKNICLHKSDAEYVIVNSGADAAVRDDLAGKIKKSAIEVATRTNIPGYDYRDLKGVPFMECLLACENDPVCRSFSYTRAKKWCWLKSDAGQVESAKGVDSGIKR